MIDEASRLVQHVCGIINQNGVKVDPSLRVTLWGIDAARTHFGANKHVLLDFITGLIIAYHRNLASTKEVSNFDFEAAILEGKKTADDLAVFDKGDKSRLVAPYYNLGLAARNFQLHDLSTELFEAALKFSGDDESLAEPVLKKLESVYAKEEGPLGSCPKLAKVLERLLDFDQANPEEDNARRFRLVEHYKSTGRFKKIREVLAPLVMRLGTYDYTMFQVVCHGMADSYQLEGKHDIAGPWVMRAVEMRPEHHRN